MGRLIHKDDGKLLRYGNFTNSITKSFSNNNYSCINQNFGRYEYNLLRINAGDNIDRTSLMSYGNMNATHCYSPYNLKLHSTVGYWGNGTMHQTSDYLVKEENVFPNSSLSTPNSGYAEVHIPNKLIGQLLNTYIYFFVTLDNSILGYNGHFPVGIDFPREPEIYPYDGMTTDYVLIYSFHTNYDRGKNMSIGTNVPTKIDCYANVFIFIPNRNNIACSITYNPTTAYTRVVNANFSTAQIYDGNHELLMTGAGYSLYVDGRPNREGYDDYAGEAEITFKNIY